MTKQHTPQDAVTSVLANPVLPHGDDERFVGFGIMGLPFANGHYLAMRQFPRRASRPRTCRSGTATRTATGHSTPRRPDSRAARATSAQPLRRTRCNAISSVDWAGPWSVRVEILGLLRWTFRTAGDRGDPTDEHGRRRLSESAWSDPTTLRRLSRAATRTLGVGDIRLTGRAPNGQCYMMAPKQFWVVADSHAVLEGRDLGPSGPLLRQPRLGDFRMPQRGIGMVGSGHFETFDRSTGIARSERAHSFA